MPEFRVSITSSSQRAVLDVVRDSVSKIQEQIRDLEDRRESHLVELVRVILGDYPDLQLDTPTSFRMEVDGDVVTIVGNPQELAAAGDTPDAEENTDD